MKRPFIFLLALLLFGFLPSASWGQDAPPPGQEAPPPDLDAPPPGLGEVETARSRDCVGRLARLADLNATLAPMAQRLARLNALGRAVSLEKTGDVMPFDEEDPLEADVAGWFSADSALAVRYIATADSAILRERAANRTSILERLNEAMQTNVERGQQLAAAGADVRQESLVCDGAIFVRQAVVDACATTQSPICGLAGSLQEPDTTGRFVEAPEDLWDIEQYRPWTQPGGLQRGPNGGLTGARTLARARRGNVVFSLALAPLIQRRSEISEEEVQASVANLDSLGFTFDHPDFVMAPGFEFQAQLPSPIGGETHYVLHLGDLSGDDVLWSFEAGEMGLVQLSFPASVAHLARLRAGEPVSLTALRVVEEEGVETGAEGVFTLTLLQVGQATNVASLLEYMGNGSLGQDLAALVPPGGVG